jgi:hypothetical protein
MDRPKLGPDTVAARFPYLKLTEVGDYATGMLIDYARVQKLKYNTQDLDFYEEGEAKGKPKMKTVLTLLLIDPLSASVVMPRQPGEQESMRVPAEAGLVAQLHVDGRRSYEAANPACFQAVQQSHGRWEVGDVIGVRLREKTRMAKDGRSISVDSSIWDFAARQPGEQESSLVERAIAEYRKLEGAVQLPSQGAPELTLVPQQPQSEAQPQKFW